MKRLLPLVVLVMAFSASGQTPEQDAAIKNGVVQKPIEATAICRDGTQSTSPDRKKACDGHKGIGAWLADRPAPEKLITALSDVEVAEKIKNIEKSKKFTVTYDKFQDITRVSSQILVVKIGTGLFKSNLLMRISCAGKGRDLQKTGRQYYIAFEAFSSDWSFLRNHDLIFLTEAGRVNVGDGSWDGRVSKPLLTVGVSEYMSFVVNEADLRTLAESRSIEFQLGSYEAVLDSKHREAFQNMYIYTAMRK